MLSLILGALIVIIAVVSLLTCAVFVKKLWVLAKLHSEHVAVLNKWQTDKVENYDSNSKVYLCAVERSVERSAQHSLILEGLSKSTLNIKQQKKAITKASDELRLGSVSHQYFYQIHSVIMKYNTTSYRTEEVGVTTIYGKVREFPRPEELEELMNEFLNWFNSTNPKDVFIFAADAKFKFLCIHPFKKGNGKLSRALYSAIIKTKHEDFPFITIDAERRLEYLTAIEHAEENLIVRKEALYYFLLSCVKNSVEVFIKDLQEG